MFRVGFCESSLYFACKPCLEKDSIDQSTLHLIQSIQEEFVISCAEQDKCFVSFSLAV